MEATAYRRMIEFIRQCPDEIQGFGQVTLDRATNVIKVHNVFILKQEVTGGSAEIEEEDMDKLLHHCIKSDIPIETVKFWWHSHVDFAAFWSGTDTGTIDMFDNGWMVSLVGNKMGHAKTRLDIYDPCRVVQELGQPSIFWEKDEAFQKQVKEEIDDKVERKVLASTGYVHAGRGAYESDYDGCGGWRDRFDHGSHAGAHGRGNAVHGTGHERRSAGGVGRGFGGGAQSSYSDVRGGRRWEEKSRGVGRPN
jgi:hypothetical protein